MILEILFVRKSPQMRVPAIAGGKVAEKAVKK